MFHCVNKLIFYLCRISTWQYGIFHILLCIVLLFLIINLGVYDVYLILIPHTLTKLVWTSRYERAQKSRSLTAQATIFLSTVTEPEVITMSLQNCDSDNVGSTFEKEAVDQVMNKICPVLKV